jgi:hypothetical protein
MCFLAIWISSFEKVLLSSVTHFLMSLKVPNYYCISIVCSINF